MKSADSVQIPAEVVFKVKSFGKQWIYYISATPDYVNKMLDWTNLGDGPH